MSLSAVSSVLWRERELLELLAFKLEEEQLLLAAGRARWLGFATRELELVLAEIQRSELDRAVEVDAAAAELGLPAGISLRELAERVPSPWHEILREHRTALLTLADEIVELAETDRHVLGAGHRAARDVLLSLTSQEPPTDAPGGRSAAGKRGLSLLHQAD